MNKLDKRILVCLFFASIQTVFAQQAHINVDWRPQKNTENLVPMSANVISPEVLDDQSVIFRLKGPEVSEVLLVGSIFVGKEAGKEVPFEKGKDGIWILKIAPLIPNIYFYWFIIDGVKVIDPNNYLMLRSITVLSKTDMPEPFVASLWGEGMQNM